MKDPFSKRDICRYEYMIDNVILLLKGTLNGRDVNELIEKVIFWHFEGRSHLLTCYLVFGA